MLIYLTGFFGENHNKLTLIVGPKTQGQVYYKARDICRVLKLSTLPQMRRSVRRSTKRYWDVSEKYKHSNTFVLSTDEIFALFEDLSPRARNRDFEAWFSNLNSGSTKLISQKNPKIVHEYLKRIADKAIIDSSANSKTGYKSPHYLTFPLLGEYQRLYVNEYLHIPTCDVNETGILEETEESKALQLYTFTLPELVDIIKTIPVVNRRNEAATQFENFSQKSQTIAADTSNDGNSTLKRPNSSVIANVKPNEVMSIVRQDQSFEFHDTLTGKKYNFVAFGTEWKGDTVRPMHIFPFSFFNTELNEHFVYVPMELKDKK